ncbi:hypothetical protein BABINDRAFT_161707 [Babjeviella inositovora NRRL Y-12698]|uniref:Uncharacterized protein n=1 Tax=Babjeviella inositovora NRRL Y-12698 TaxID=984486 RepID=A0A1E3QSS9_9ASCO|nr:uncharacterized protein BABINDRAFT_161707 [Babjeviella inositovora NRRL Y-12698]ODQ80072.1 hypothetical protein BABINDRAFT_161707 [Babjeviella inositovora NRRL Y-12698]
MWLRFICACGTACRSHLTPPVKKEVKLFGVRRTRAYIAGGAISVYIDRDNKPTFLPNQVTSARSQIGAVLVSSPVL